MQFRVLIGLMLGLCVWTDASASCAQPYTGAVLSRDMGAISSALRAKDQTAFAEAGARLAQGLPCTHTVLPVPALANAYRFIGLHYARGAADAEARRYFRSALELDPSFEWGLNQLDLTDPARAMFEAERASAQDDPVRLEGKVFSPPADAEVYIDGRRAKEVEARLDRPHLVQLVSNDIATATHLIDGNAFPEGLVGLASAVVRNRGRGGGPEQVQRLRPPAKTPLLIVGGTGLVAGAGLYAASFATRSSFDSATTTDDVWKYQSTTNALVLASGVSVLVGLGTGYAGFLLDGGPGLFYHFRY